MRTYVGARYTPDFKGTYDPTQDYESLVVVDNGMGTSYITSKPTPAGTPLTDRNYWQLYGATSGAIINLQNQIDSINDTLSDIEGLNDIIENAIDLQNKKICIVGDSISASDDSWVGAFKTLCGDYVTVDNYSQSGKQWNNSDGASDPCVADVIDDLTTPYDIFIIFCGVNDFLNSCPFGNINTDTIATTFNGAIYAAHEKILANNPSAKVFIIAPTKTRYNPNPNTLDSTLAMYRLMLYTHAIRYGWNFIDAYTHAPLIDISKITGGVVGAPWLADGLHFARVYYPFFAKYILNSILADKNDNIGYRKYERLVSKEGFDYLYYGFDTNGVGYVRLKAAVSNVYAGSLYLVLNDLPGWLYSYDKTIDGVVTETSGASRIPSTALVKADGNSIYFYADRNFTDGYIEIDAQLETQNFTYFEDFSW